MKEEILKNKLRINRHLNCKQCGYPKGELSFWDLQRLPQRNSKLCTKLDGNNIYF